MMNKLRNFLKRLPSCGFFDVPSPPEPNLGASADLKADIEALRDDRDLSLNEQLRLLDIIKSAHNAICTRDTTVLNQQAMVDQFQLQVRELLDLRAQDAELIINLRDQNAKIIQDNSALKSQINEIRTRVEQVWLAHDLFTETRESLEEVLS